MRTYRRGEIYYAQLNPVVGSEQDGVRPVLIIQNDTGNRYSPTTIVAPISSKEESRPRIPTHIFLPDLLGVPSIILMEQIRTIDKRRLAEYAGRVNNTVMGVVNEKIMISLGVPFA